MPPEYTGRGDAKRTMALLWGTQPIRARGPKPGLSVEQVVRAAVDLADEHGLDALSMRRVAEQLGVGTMSIYTYVPGKAELVDVMVDTVYGEQAEALAASPEVASGDWRAGLEARARIDWDLYQRHPWLHQVIHARSVLGPNETAVFDATLRIVEEIGLSAREMVAAVDLVVTYVGGAASGASDAGSADEATGKSEDEWWLEREPLLTEQWNPERFPTATRVAAAGGFDVPDDATSYSLQFLLDDFEFGLQRLLDGIDTYIGSHGDGHP